MKTALITGAAGFIGHHMARFVKEHGMYDRVVGVDIVDIGDNGYPDYLDVFIQADLRDSSVIPRIMKGVDHVYHFAAHMGGLGFITGRDAEVMYNNAQIDLNVIGGAAESAAGGGVSKLLYTSSAVVYPEVRQGSSRALNLREDEAWGGFPSEGGYGVEKLFGESLCTYIAAQGVLETRVVRLHNVFGPEGAWDNGKEKVPAALCRKVASATQSYSISSHKIEVEIDVWGDGKQTRSFLYIEDALRGIASVMACGYSEPLNVGSDRLVSINELADIIGEIAGVKVAKNYVDGPVGVRGRNSDNCRVMRTTGWRPRVSLEEGLRETYSWISQQVLAANR